ncbi:unnamed protein product [Symbiodinium sp. CCMP2456]|nr:unnamed protein product [Symbiodinium sp. CCMP2456]
MKEVEESSLSLSGLIPPMGHPPSLREAGAFVGAARKASLKQPLKFDNVQGFIVDCMKQTARGEPSTPSSSRADKALGIHEPKLVIRLVPCQKGRTYWEGRPAIRNILPTKANPELEGHEQMVETDMNLIAREVLLPVAMKTQALIIGTSSCSLTTAFAEVSAPIQRRYGDECPFLGI